MANETETVYQEQLTTISFVKKKNLIPFTQINETKIAYETHHFWKQWQGILLEFGSIKIFRKTIKQLTRIFLCLIHRNGCIG